MPYPPAYARLYNFNNDDARGLESPAPAKLDAELDGIQESIDGLRNTVVGITSASGTLKPSQPVDASEVQVRAPDTFTATAGQTVFTYAGGAIVLAQTFVKVYVAGLRLPAADYTVGTTTVTLDTGAALNDIVIVEFYDVQDYALTQLADDSDPALGAGLVGYNDQNTYGTQLPITGSPSTVNDTLDLALQNLINLGDTFFPVTQWIASDGSQELLDNWDTGGTYRIRGLPVSLVDGDVVVHQQLTALNSAIAGLSATFLAIDGSSTMAGDLDMGNNSIVSMAAGTTSGEAVEYDQYIAGLATKLSLDGTTAMTAALHMGDFKITGLANGTALTDAATYGQVLSGGIPLLTKRDVATYDTGAVGNITDLGSGQKRWTAPAGLEGAVVVVGLGGGGGGAGGAQGAAAGLTGVAGGDTQLTIGGSTYILAKGGSPGAGAVNVTSPGGAGGLAGGATVPGVLAYAGSTGDSVLADVSVGGDGADSPVVVWGKIPDLPYYDGAGGAGGLEGTTSSAGAGGAVYGAGGGGGGTDGTGDNGGAGGGSGAIGVAFISLAAGEYFDFTVGAGGAGGNAAANEHPGGATAYTAPGNDGEDATGGEGAGGGSGAAGAVYVYYKTTVTVNEV